MAVVGSQRHTPYTPRRDPRRCRDKFLRRGHNPTPLRDIRVSPRIWLRNQIARPRPEEMVEPHSRENPQECGPGFVTSSRRSSNCSAPSRGNLAEAWDRLRSDPKLVRALPGWGAFPAFLENLSIPSKAQTTSHSCSGV